MRRSPPPDIALRAGTPEDLPRLNAIDRAGTLLLASHGFPTLADELPTVEDTRALVTDRALWVAADGNDRAVGFAVASDPGPCLYLHELSVDPARGREGIGSMLLEAVVAHARWAFHSAVALDTFRTVPFNAPFYSRHGFMAMEPGAVHPDIADLVRAARPPGIHPASRVVMAKRL